MTALLLAAPVLSLLLLGAHFFRAGQPLLVGLSLALAILACLPHRVAVRAVQVALAAGALEWARTTVILASARQAAGLPWTRLALILGAVALFTAASALVFYAPRLKTRRQGSPAA